MFSIIKKNKKKGYGMIEILVGTAIFSSVLVAAVFAVTSIADLDRRTTSIIRANYLLLEGIDVVKILRDTSWSSEVSSLSLNTPYYIYWDTGSWQATTSVSVIDALYHRTIELESVNRDANDNIAIAGTLDPGTLKVTSSVSWNLKGSTTTREFDTYIMDLYAN